MKILYVSTLPKPPAPPVSATHSPCGVAVFVVGSTDEDLQFARNTATLNTKSSLFLMTCGLKGFLGEHAMRCDDQVGKAIVYTSMGGDRRKAAWPLAGIGLLARQLQSQHAVGYMAKVYVPARGVFPLFAVYLSVLFRFTFRAHPVFQ